MMKLQCDRLSMALYCVRNDAIINAVNEKYITITLMGSFNEEITAEYEMYKLVLNYQSIITNGYPKYYKELYI